MTNILLFFIILIICESILRFLSLQFCPFQIRVFYAIGFLSEKKYEEWRLLSSRVKRSGFKTYKELLEHYAKISGSEIKFIKKISDGMMPWSIKK